MNESNSNRITNGNSCSSQRDEPRVSFQTPIKGDEYTIKPNILSPKIGRVSISMIKNNDLNIKKKRNIPKQETFTERVTFEGTKIEEHRKRFDRKGVEITPKNKKKIKVAFADTALGQPLIEVINIESYKDYNVIGYSPPEKEVFGKTNTCCSCILV